MIAGMGKPFKIAKGSYRPAPRHFQPAKRRPAHRSAHRPARAGRSIGYPGIVTCALLLFVAILWGPEWIAGEPPLTAPTTGPTTADRATDRAAPGERLAFSKCHSGGGYNCVVDGDTIWLKGEKIRLLDIDTPETHPPRCAEEARLGHAATDRLQTLLNGGAVSMNRDGTDGYDRTLAVVLVDGRPVGEHLIAEGLARHYGGGRKPWC